MSLGVCVSWRATKEWGWNGQTPKQRQYLWSDISKHDIYEALSINGLGASSLTRDTHIQQGITM